MPVNWEHLHTALRELRRDARAQAAIVKDARAASLAHLRAYAHETQMAERVVNLVSRSEPELRCAVPVEEQLDMGFGAGSASQAQVIIAADGSQVTPDRHEQVQFGVVNVGTVVMRPNSHEAPTVSTETEILFGEGLYGRDGRRLSEGDIALLRDRRERANLVLRAGEAAGLTVALTDGPLELWGAKDVTDPEAFEQALRNYVADLEAMRRLGCALAGYVDKPGADLVIRLLELLTAGPEDLQHVRAFHPLRGATDRWLFAQILGAGERSAVFRLQSSSTLRYVGDVSIHFFYLNVGAVNHPAIARVEIPKWVASDPGLLGSIHATLLEQCSILGASPYPYILHRAHELARISLDEKEEIRLRLMLELREAGVEMEAASGKSVAKASSDLKGRY